METKILSRAYLETLSSADLIALADDYGIDVPDDLSRRFIIGELLEVAEELKQDLPDNGGMNIADAEIAESELPESFNETQIGMVMRNPVWAFVYWDIRESDRAAFTPENGFSNLVLRVSFFDDEDTNTPEESFDVQIDSSVREQYVLFPAGKKFVRVDLVAQYRSKDDNVLAYTAKYALPRGSKILSQAYPAYDMEISPLAELSSLKELLRLHYQNHRQSFLS
ncbi:MAG: DUF4912 domain-containing protein [Treponema sp.]|nr:DUF4912 domain-containing protein [Treponema sp.]